MITEFFFATRASLFSDLTARCSELMSQAVTQYGSASIALSGGNTPLPLFQALGRRNLPWEQISIALTDERWVSPDHPASNEGLIRGSLLSECASRAKFVGMKTEHEDPADAWSTIETLYRRFARPFDLVLLGMGNDGHTASLFPGAVAADTNLQTTGRHYCAAIDASSDPQSGYWPLRMSLTLAGILHAQQIVLLITGERKLLVYRQARTASDSGALPVAAVLQQSEIPVEVYWAPEDEDLCTQ